LETRHQSKALENKERGSNVYKKGRKLPTVLESPFSRKALKRF